MSTTKNIIQKDIAKKKRDKFKNKMVKSSNNFFLKIGKRRQEQKRGETENDKMEDWTISIITLNVNGLNILAERQRLWD